MERIPPNESAMDGAYTRAARAEHREHSSAVPLLFYVDDVLFLMCFMCLKLFFFS